MSSRLPDLSSLRVLRDTPSDTRVAAVGVRNSDNYYQSMTPECPKPAEAGDLRKAVRITPGDSGILFPPDSFAGSALMDESYDKLYVRDSIQDDWQQGHVVLQEDTEFVHVSSTLPEEMVSGQALRSDMPIFAHTDVQGWVWGDADRVVIEWPAGLPFQIMATKTGEDGDSKYLRSCRYLQKEDTDVGDLRKVQFKPGTMEFKDSEKQVEGGETFHEAQEEKETKMGVEWPYAHAAIVIPSAFFTVVNTPTQTPTPDAVFQEAAATDEYRNIAYRIGLTVNKSDASVVFTSTDKNDVSLLYTKFDLMKDSLGRPLYFIRQEPVPNDQLTRSELLSFFSRGAVDGRVFKWQLSVKRARLFSEDVRVRAHAIDMTFWLAANVWTPNTYTFQKAGGSTRPVVIAEELMPTLYCLTLGGKRHAFDNLQSAAALQEAVDSQKTAKEVEKIAQNLQGVEWSSVLNSTNVSELLHFPVNFAGKPDEDTKNGNCLTSAMRACVWSGTDGKVNVDFMEAAQEMLLKILRIPGVDPTLSGGVLVPGSTQEENIFDFLFWEYRQRGVKNNDFAFKIEVRLREMLESVSIPEKALEEAVARAERTGYKEHHIDVFKERFKRFFTQ